MNFKITIQYDGANFYGWAAQPNKRTVQQTLVDHFQNLFKLDEVKLYGSGRTDRFVHAKGQVFNVHLTNLKIDSDQLKKALNASLDDDLKVIDVVAVDNSFHAQYDAINKTYEYVIDTTHFSLFERNYCWQINQQINLNKLKEALAIFIGEFDFLSYSTSELYDTTRSINFINVKEENQYIKIYINANGFLKNMVRMIVAASVDYSLDKVELDQLKQWLKEPKKGASTKLAPGCGLYLLEVNY